MSMLASIESAVSNFFDQLTKAVGFGGYLAIALGVQFLFIAIYGIKSAFSYEARFKRAMEKANRWLYMNKKLTIENIKEFTRLIKKGPRRITYFWQQYIMYRDGGPANYLSEENLIEKPMRTSSWQNNVKNLGIATGIWACFSLIIGMASQGNSLFTFKGVILGLVFPALVVALGGIACIMIKGFRVYNLEDVYQGYHIFARFLTNACDDLPPYIELDLLFNPKELSRASVQLREFYEANARKAKEAFEEAKRREEKIADYNFKDVGVDGALLLDRAMKESENYINQKTKTLSQIAQVEAQKDAMRRNYENIQMDLQRKIQASKENIQKLIEQQAATTSRIEVGLLRQQQDKEAKKLDELQRDYDKEETRYKADRDEHEKEIARLSEIMDESLAQAERGMSAEYQTFFEKVMKSAYAVAEKKVEKEKKEITKQKDINEKELIAVQTQIKRLLDENVTLRAKLAEYNPDFKSQKTPNGHYNEQGNFVYLDGSYHDEQGLFHDVDGNVYDMNGVKVSKDYSEEEVEQNQRQAIVDEQINQFGSYIADEDTKTESQEVKAEQIVAEEAPIEEPEKVQMETSAVEEKRQPRIEEFVWDEEETAQEKTVEEEVQPETEEVEGFDIDLSAPEEEAEVEESDQPIVEEEIKQASETVPTSTGKKRGRPRKVVVEQPVQAPAKKRGRPRKEEQSPVVTAAATKAVSKPKPTTKNTNEKEESKTARPKPRKRVAVKEEKTETSPAKKRGRPRKEQQPVVNETPAKKRGRPRKSPILNEDIDSLERISQLISEEEEKLNKMKVLLNSEIDQVMVEDKDADKEREELLKAFEQLKAQANQAKNGGNSDDLASINKRLEDLIKEINVLNNRK